MAKSWRKIVHAMENWNLILNTVQNSARLLCEKRKKKGKERKERKKERKKKIAQPYRVTFFHGGCFEYSDWKIWNENRKVGELKRNREVAWRVSAKSCNVSDWIRSLRVSKYWNWSNFRDTGGNGGREGVLAESIRFYRIDVIPRIFSLRRVSKEISAPRKKKEEITIRRYLFIYIFGLVLLSKHPFLYEFFFFLLGESSLIRYYHVVMFFFRQIFRGRKKYLKELFRSIIDIWVREFIILEIAHKFVYYFSWSLTINYYN